MSYEASFDAGRIPGESSPVPYSLSAWCALTVCIHAACVDAPAHPTNDIASSVSQPTKPTVTQPTIPIERVFPPAWKVGDKWRVSMKTQVHGIPVRGPYKGPEFRTVEFEFRVTAVPSDTDAEGVYRLDIRGADDGDKLQYYGLYRAKPFSFLRLEDEQGKAVAQGDETNPAVPYLGGDRGAFIKDFPVLPTPATFGSVPFVVDAAPATQEIESTPTGLRFTFTRYDLHVVMEWKAGAPWWSSLERIALPLPGLNWPPQFLGSGTLLTR
jgi:hypothetical protein